MNIFVALWGLLLGLTVGFTSIGTGILGSPGLILLFGIEPVIAVGTIILTAVPMMFSSVIRHWKNRNIQWNLAIFFSITAFPAAFFTARMAENINRILPVKNIIATVILISVPLLIYRYFFSKDKEDNHDFILTPFKTILAPIFGLILGAVMGATGITGSLTIIVFLLIFRLPSPLAIGTTSVVGLISLIFAGSAHFTAGNYHLPTLISLLPGVIIGAFVGAHLVHRVPRKILQLAVLTIVTVAGIWILI